METTLADGVGVINLARHAVRLTVGALALIALLAAVVGPRELADLATDAAAVVEPDTVEPAPTPTTQPTADAPEELPAVTLPPAEAARNAKLAGPDDSDIIGAIWTYGDDPRLDVLWRQCESGRGDSCDRLFDESPLNSDYERFGLTCGDRPTAIRCEDTEI